MIEQFFQNSGFWVLLSTVVCTVILVKYGRVPLMSMLDTRTRRVEERLDEAEELLSEARALLASYERKNIEAMEEAETIVMEARIKADRLRKKSEKQLAETIDRLEKTAEGHLEKARKDAELTIREHLTEHAIIKAKDLLEKDPKKMDKATDIAIEKALESFADKYPH